MQLTSNRRDDSVVSSLRELRTLEDARRADEDAEQRRAEEAAAAAIVERARLRQVAIAEEEASAAAEARAERLAQFELEARVHAEAEAAVLREAAVEAATRRALNRVELSVPQAIVRAPSKAPLWLAVIASVALGAVAAQRQFAVEDLRSEVSSVQAMGNAASEDAGAKLLRLEVARTQLAAELAQARTELAELRTVGSRPPAPPPPSAKPPVTRPPPSTNTGSNKPPPPNVATPPVVISHDCLVNPLC